jgi:tetratricopeptide (TPR) repeat protein
MAHSRVSRCGQGLCRSLIKGAAAALVLALSVDPSIAATTDFLDAGVVIVPDAPVYPMPDTSAAPMARVAIGEVLFTFDTLPPEYQRDWEHPRPWHQIRLNDGRRGWMTREQYKLLGFQWLTVRGLADSAAVWSSASAGSCISHLSAGEECGLSLARLSDSSGATNLWYRVKRFYDHNAPRWSDSPGAEGWVRAQDVTLGTEMMLLIAGDHLAQWNNDVYWGHETSDQNARLIYQRIRRDYPNLIFRAPEEYSEELPYLLHSDVEALEKIAKLEERAGEYDSAVSTLESIIDHYPDVHSGTGLASGQAWLNIAKIVGDELHLPDSALAIYRKVIRDYPDEEISGFEWNSTLGVSAFDALRDWHERGGLCDSICLAEYQWIADSATFDVLAALACLEKAGVFVEMKRLDDAVDVLRLAIDRFAKTRMYFYTEQLDFEQSALENAVRILCDFKIDTAAAVQLCREVDRNHPRDMIGQTACAHVVDLQPPTPADSNSLPSPYAGCDRQTDPSESYSNVYWPRAIGPPPIDH